MRRLEHPRGSTGEPARRWMIGVGLHCTGSWIEGFFLKHLFILFSGWLLIGGALMRCFELERRVPALVSLHGG